MENNIIFSPNYIINSCNCVTGNKYFFGNKFFLIKIIKTSNCLGVNFYNSDKQKNAAFCPAVETCQGTFCKLYPGGGRGGEKQTPYSLQHTRTDGATISVGLYNAQLCIF